MKSEINEEFLKAYRRLPKEVRARARASYRLFRDNPYHPSLLFKRLEGQIPTQYALGDHTGHSVS